MIIDKMIPTVDLHTAGEPVRAVLGGIQSVPGKTMEEKQQFFFGNQQQQQRTKRRFWQRKPKEEQSEFVHQ